MNNVVFSFHDVLNKKETDDFETKEETNDKIGDFDINDYVQRFFDDDDETGEDNDHDQYQIYAAHQYDTAFSVKDLMKICEYYGIHKQCQCQKYKKMEVIYAILLFENDPTNETLVEKRKAFWGYMDELKQDKFMKRFVVW